MKMKLFGDAFCPNVLWKKSVCWLHITALSFKELTDNVCSILAAHLEDLNCQFCIVFVLLLLYACTF